MDQRIILETGIGSDLYGLDYTKAALRAVNDAIRHSSLTLFSELGLDHTKMTVKVTIGVQDPDALDIARIAAELPRGNAQVTAVQGGQNIPSADGSTATASVIGVDLADCTANHSITGDLMDRAFCDILPARAVDTMGGLDILINNAGIITRGGITAATPADHFATQGATVFTAQRGADPTHQGIEADFLDPTAPFLLIKAALPHLISSKGSIVNIGSIEG